MENFTTTRYEGKIETFDPCIIDVQERDITQNIVNQTQETVEIQVETHENNGITPMQEANDQPIQATTVQNSQQNLTLTPVRLPAILDGEFYSVIRVDDTNVTVRCLQCQKLLNGNLKSTGNFLSHIKVEIFFFLIIQLNTQICIELINIFFFFLQRVHPFMIDKIKCKSNQRKPAIAYIDLSAEKCPEIIRTKRGYRKCYKTVRQKKLILLINYQRIN